MKAKEALIFVPAEYLDFANVFSEKLTAVLPDHTKINTNAIDLEEDKQPPYGFIYSLGLVKLETLKTYIETNLANSFIHLSKSPADTPILFDQKFNESLQLCVNYWGFNNLTIKNQYLLQLIGKSLDWLECVKRFTQLDFTNVYHQIRIKEGDQ